MAYYNTNAFKAGLKIILDEVPYQIIENEFVKPGKGQAFNRVKVKNLKSGRVIDKTFKSGEKVQAADIMEIDMQYLYQDGTHWHFMDQNSYEQFQVDSDILGDQAQWLTEQTICKVLLWDGMPIGIEAPNFVTLAVTETEPGFRGDTAQGGVKPAALETGANVGVPLFVEVGDRLKIDTRTGEYVSRVKG